MQRKIKLAIDVLFSRRTPPKNPQNRKNLTQTNKKNLQQDTKPKTTKQNNKTKTLISEMSRSVEKEKW